MVQLGETFCTGPPAAWLPSHAIPSPAHMAWLAQSLLLVLRGSSCPDSAPRALELECRVMAHWIGCSAETEPGEASTGDAALSSSQRESLAELFLRGAPKLAALPASTAPPPGAANPRSADGAAAAEEEGAADACEQNARLGGDWALVTTLVATQPALTGAQPSLTCRNTSYLPYRACTNPCGQHSFRRTGCSAHSQETKLLGLAKYTYCPQYLGTCTLQLVIVRVTLASSLA